MTATESGFAWWWRLSIHTRLFNRKRGLYNLEILDKMKCYKRGWDKLWVNLVIEQASISSFSSSTCTIASVFAVRSPQNTKGLLALKKSLKIVMTC